MAELFAPREKFQLGSDFHLNFKIFDKVCEKAYRQLPPHYSIPLDEVKDVFHFYFFLYHHDQGKDHPNMTVNNVLRIIEEMPYIYNSRIVVNVDCLDAEINRALIAAYFSTPMNCDRNINHFFSGDIRAIKFHETEYRDIPIGWMPDDWIEDWNDQSTWLVCSHSDTQDYSVRIPVPGRKLQISQPT